MMKSSQELEPVLAALAALGDIVRVQPTSQGGIVVAPATQEAAEAAIEICGRFATPIVVGDARGEAGAPVAPPLFLSTARLTNHLEIDAANMVAIVAAGSVVGRIREEAAAAGLWCAALERINPATSIGAAVAGGHGWRNVHDDALAGYLLGSRFVAPAVGLVRHGGRAIKNASGYNLSAMLAGSRGRLGVITEVTLRLAPRPRHRSIDCFEFHDLQATLTFIREHVLAEPTAEAIDLEIPLPELSPGRLMVELDGLPSTRQSLLRQRATAVGLVLIADPSTSKGQAAEEPLLRCRGIAPTTSLGAVIEQLAEITRPVGTRGSIVASARSGALEVELRPVDPAQTTFLRARLSALDLRWSLEPGAAGIEDALRAAFDPRGILQIRE